MGITAGGEKNRRSEGWELGCFCGKGEIYGDCVGGCCGWSLESGERIVPCSDDEGHVLDNRQHVLLDVEPTERTS